jgi:hypothetical protein
MQASSHCATVISSQHDPDFPYAAVTLSSISGCFFAMHAMYSEQTLSFVAGVLDAAPLRASSPDSAAVGDVALDEVPDPPFGEAPPVQAATSETMMAAKRRRMASPVSFTP